MGKTTPPPAAAPQPPAEAPVLPMPTTGGAWVRNPDGTLSRDLAEHPAEAEPKE